MHRALTALAAIGLALGACGSPASGSPEVGSLELRWRAAPGDLDGLPGLVVRPDWAGANRGDVRDERWREVPVVAPAVRLPGTDGSVRVAQGKLPVGRYDRVFVAAPTVLGLLPDGSRAPLVSHIEPIARGFDLRPGGQVTIEIDLIVRPGSSVSESAGRREVFVKDARLVADPGAWTAACDRVPHAPILVGIGTRAGGVAQGSVKERINMTDTAMTSAVHAFFQALVAPDTDAFVSLFAEDAVVEDPVGGPVLRSHDDVARFHTRLHQAWSSIDMTVKDLIPRGDRAAVRWAASGLSTSGKRVTFAGIDVMAVDDRGRITRLEAFWDFEGVIAQL